MITGATGFLGGALTQRLVAGGARVTALGRNEKQGQRLVKMGARFVKTDLSERAAIGAACLGQDAVIHAGAISSPWGKYADFYSANVAGTENVIAGCIAAGTARMVHISTPSLYVEARDRLGVREGDPLPAEPINYYAATKKLAEAKVDEAFARGLPVVTLRPQGLFGTGDTAIMPRVIRLAKKGTIPMIGDGQTQMDLTYIDNVVDAVICAMNAPEDALGKKFNITNGDPVSFYGTMESMLKRMNIPFRFRRIPFKRAWQIAWGMEQACKYLFRSTEPLLTRYSVCVLGKSRTLDISAARAELGYVPRISMAEGMDRFLRESGFEGGA